MASKTNNREFPRFNEYQIKEANDLLNKYGDNRACSNNHLFSNSVGTVYSGNYSYMSLKRTFLRKCKLIEANFEGAAVTGSIFINCEFSQCIINGANFQCCDFIESIFKGQFEGYKIIHSNFSNGRLTKCKFENTTFYKSTIYETVFDNCSFNNSAINISTLEGSQFNKCSFTNVDLSNLNIDYTVFKEPKMSNVILPFYQAPYIINMLPYIANTDDEVRISSEISSGGKIDIATYKSLWELLIIRFFSLNEFFPMANLYLAQKKKQESLACIYEGVERAIKLNDFRLIKHFCRLMTSTEEFTAGDTKSLYNLIESRFKPGLMASDDLYGYLNNIAEIRRLLLKGDFGMQSLEIRIKTNIKSSDAKKISKFVEAITPIMDEMLEGTRSSYIELRHNSDYEIVFRCVEWLPILIGIAKTMEYSFNRIEQYYKIKGIALDNRRKEKELEEEEKKRVLAQKLNKPQIMNNIIEVLHFIEGADADEIIKCQQYLYSQTSLIKQDGDAKTNNDNNNTISTSQNEPHVNRKTKKNQPKLKKAR